MAKYYEMPKELVQSYHSNQKKHCDMRNINPLKAVMVIVSNHTLSELLQLFPGYDTLVT